MHGAGLWSWVRQFSADHDYTVLEGRPSRAEQRFRIPFPLQPRSHCRKAARRMQPGGRRRTSNLGKHAKNCGEARSLVRHPHMENDRQMQRETREFLSSAQKELARVSHIATQTLSFHRQSAQPIPVSPLEIIDSVVALYPRGLRRQVWPSSGNAGPIIRSPHILESFWRASAGFFESTEECSGCDRAEWPRGCSGARGHRYPHGRVRGADHDCRLRAWNEPRHSQAAVRAVLQHQPRDRNGTGTMGDQADLV